MIEIFQHPHVLIGIPGVLLVLLLLFLRARARRRAFILALTAKGEQHPVWRSHSLTRTRIKGVLTLTGIVVLLVALARPQWGFDWREFPGKNHDLIFVLDISRSMMVPDIHPNRLERAKLVIRELADGCLGADLGLMVYARSNFLQCPQTRDHNAFYETLSIQQPSLLGQGSRAADALMAAAGAIRKDKNTTILLVSDGEDFSRELEQTLRFLRAEGVQVHTLCIGTPRGGLIPSDDGDPSQPYFRDRTNKPVYSSARPATMRHIAQFLSGEHWFMQSEAFDVRAVIPHLSPSQPNLAEELEKKKIPREFFQGPLLLAWVLLCVELALGNRRIEQSTTHQPSRAKQARS